ncbi:CDGSH iron-sulfur domain-containing protein [Shewanella youngdeokensis]|uniref:CDGSH iron-sulfur domain-containing protein n=1 Tax=Shewanella youngdeokensis TaxID=2999068 RepID=A0ABZ0K3B6_9GAMM|nr:CDGSH iron-sulfur domain-containing protein [Shewanella sp. DAU334]
MYAEENEEAYLCQCKYSKVLPFCDGTHKPFTDIGKKM